MRSAGEEREREEAFFAICNWRVSRDGILDTHRSHPVHGIDFTLKQTDITTKGENKTRTRRFGGGEQIDIDLHWVSGWAWALTLTFSGQIF